MQQEFALLGLIPLLPALGALTNGVLGKRLPKLAVAAIACGAMALAFLVSMASIARMLVTAEPAHGGHGWEFATLHHHVWNWFQAGSLSVDFAFQLDPLSAIMISIITGVGFLIHVYSAGYMWEDPGFYRYFTYLNFFVFSMLCLVLGDNLVLLFLGWEGVGVASYLLIGFWFEDDDKASAGKKAFITNRVGDFAVLLAMFFIFQLFGTFNFTSLREQVSLLSAEQVTALTGLLTATSLLLFVGCTGKSAQIPLYVWLPDAMAGPTPVSALIHAATMVTAGVYLCARLNFIFALAPVAMAVIATVGALTAFFAATIGLTQYDIKKVLAYSTVSQLGYMFLAVGSGSFFAGVFHLMTHAFFKALLFLGSGSVIHGMHHEQDMRKMGGLKKYMPITRWTFLIGCMAIAGFPFLSGFFSKDEVLWFALSNQNALHQFPMLNAFVWTLGVAAAAMTAFYMFRAYHMTFSGECRADEETKHHIHESPWSMTIPLIVLAGLSVVGGLVGISPEMGGPISKYLDMHGFLHGVIGPGEALYFNRFGHESPAFWYAFIITLTIALSGAGAAWMLYGEKSDIPARFVAKFPRLHNVVSNKYFVDEFYAATVIRAVKIKGIILHRVVDEFVIDTVLVNGTAWMARLAGSGLRQFQNGDVQRYAALAVIAIAVIFFLIH